MAVNRFDQLGKLDLSFKLYNPVQWQPNAALWDNVFGGLQEELNTLRDLPSPKHITASAPAVKSKMEELRKERDTIIEMYKNGDFATARQKQNELVSSVTAAKNPGGWFYEEESLYNKYQKIVEDYDEILQDSPSYYKNAAKSLIKAEGSTYKNGQYEVGTASSPEIGKWRDISDEVLNKLNGFKSSKGSIIRRGNEFVYVETNEVVSESEVMDAALELITNPQYNQQLQIEARLLNYDASTIKNRADQIIGNLKAKVNSKDSQFITQVQATLASEGYWNTNIDGKSSPELNTAIEKYKQALLAVKPDELAYKQVLSSYVNPIASKLGFENQTISNLRTVGEGVGSGKGTSFSNYANNNAQASLTEVLTGTKMPGTNVAYGTLNFDINGRLRDISTLGTSSNIGQGGEIGAERLAQRKTFSNLTQNRQVVQNYPGYKEVMETRGKKEAPIVYEIYNRFRDKIENMNDKEAYEFVNKMYNAKKEALETNAVTEYKIADPDVQADLSVRWLGKTSGSGAEKNAKPGQITNSKIYVNIPGQGTKEMDYPQFLEYLGLETKGGLANLIDNSNIAGILRSDNPISPAGIRGVYTNPQNPKEVTNFVIEDPSSKYDPKYLTLHTFSQVLYNGNLLQSDALQSDLPVFIRQGRIYTKAQDIWENEKLQEDISNFNARLFAGEVLSEMEKKEYQTAKKRLEAINNNPNLNRFLGREAYFYNESNQPILDVEGKHLDLDTYRLMQEEYYKNIR